MPWQINQLRLLKIGELEKGNKQWSGGYHEQGGYLKICCFDTLQWHIWIDVKLSHTRQFMISFVNHHKVKRTVYFAYLCYVMLLADCFVCKFFLWYYVDWIILLFFRRVLFSFVWKRKNNSHNLGLARVFFSSCGGFDFLCWLKLQEWVWTRGRSLIWKEWVTSTARWYFSKGFCHWKSCGDQNFRLKMECEWC